jgi:hypothetical protein
MVLFFSEHLGGKKLYYTLHQQLGIHANFRLYTARKFDATNKLTGQEIKVKKGTFYDGKDYAAPLFRLNHTYYYTLRKRLLYLTENKVAKTDQQKQRLPQYLIANNVTELDETVKFTLKFYGSSKQGYLHIPQELDIFLKIYED